MIEWGFLGLLALLLAGAVVLVVRLGTTTLGRDHDASRPASGTRDPSFGIGAGLAIGIALGSLVGAVPWILTGEFVWWAAIVAAGMTIGVAAGGTWAARR